MLEKQPGKDYNNYSQTIQDQSVHDQRNTKKPTSYMSGPTGLTEHV